MKKLSILLISVAVLFLFSTAHAQTQDTALARIDDKAMLKKADHRLNESANPSENRTVGEEAAPEVKFILPETKDRKSKSLILDSKAGPNGEDIQMDKNGYYYYFDEAGKKLRIDSRDLRDKPKHS